MHTEREREREREREGVGEAGTTVLPLYAATRGPVCVSLITEILKVFASCLASLLHSSPVMDDLTDRLRVQTTFPSSLSLPVPATQYTNIARTSGPPSLALGN